jgi:hypothetical protein
MKKVSTAAVKATNNVSQPKLTIGLLLDTFFLNQAFAFSNHKHVQIVPNASECSSCVESWDIDSLWGITAKLAGALTLRVPGL